MLKRTLVFSNPLNLSLKNKQLVLAYKDNPERKQTIPIEDIGIIVIEHQQVNITIPLLNELTDSNVQVVLCNQKGMPNSMMINLDSNINQGEILRNQLATGEVMKKQLWKQIVEAKIKNQSRLLNKIGYDGSILSPYYNNVKSGDSDNKEGIAARVYFQTLFGHDFTRDRSMEGINTLLNYGYTILRASVSRALVSSGLFPAIGIHHSNRSNAFPLADDIMEPFRPFVDEIVHDMAMQGKIVLDKEAKSQLLGILYTDTVFAKNTRPLSVGLSFTTASLVKCYSKEQRELSLPILQ